MCKIGDIIGVPKFIGQDGKEVSFHYFVVVSDEKGKICGFNFDIVGTIMSSFKNEEQRKRKLQYEENIEIKETNFSLNGKIQRNGFIKSDQLFYFDKSKTQYFVVGQVDGNVLLCLLERISDLDKKDKLTINMSNIIESLEDMVGNHS